MKLAASLFIALAALSSASAQSSTEIRKGNVTLTLSQPGLKPLTTVLVCTSDSRTVGFTVLVNYASATAKIPMAQLPRPLDLNLLCAIGAVATDKQDIVSLDISELQENAQRFTPAN